MPACNKRRLICSADSFMHEVISQNNHTISSGMYTYDSKLNLIWIDMRICFLEPLDSNLYYIILHNLSYNTYINKVVWIASGQYLDRKKKQT